MNKWMNEWNIPKVLNLQAFIVVILHINLKGFSSLNVHFLCIETALFKLIIILARQFYNKNLITPFSASWTSLTDVDIVICKIQTESKLTLYHLCIGIKRISDKEQPWQGPTLTEKLNCILNQTRTVTVQRLNGLNTNTPF